jgi:LysW-gamma-L-lysine carboxypeptidase
MSDLLESLVRIYSPSRHEARAVEFLTGWMAAHGFRAWIDEVGNACGERGDPAARHLLVLLGHIDTYPGDLPVRLEAGRLYGRGSVDAKGSLCAFAEAAAQAAIPPGWRVLVAGALEEEATTSVGAVYLRERYTPDLCIIGEPSGAERITLGYKGRMLIDFQLSRPIAHTARPEPSVAAVAASFWDSVSEWATRENAGRERAFDTIMTRLNAINTENDGLRESARMLIAFRLPPGKSPAQVSEAVSAFAPADAVLRPYGQEIAYQSGKNNALVRGMLAAIRVNGGDPGFVLKTGTSDMNIVGAVWKCPIVAYGPGDSNLDHTPDEHLPLAEYARAIATLRTFIERLPVEVV